ncbi:MAG: hypothetical protein GF390_00965 [Candidatus Pacebacteria bacterium]|nr:hypothetical protein [Candidatus Paceibacterota bacterium]
MSKTKKPITLIKLGGSIITNKDIPMSVRQGTLARLVREIARAYRQKPNELFIVGHGGGSFPHVPAVKYKTMKGFVNGDSRIGMAITQDSAAQLNRLVTYQFIKEEIPAVSWAVSNSVVTNKRQADKFNLDVLEAYINQGLFPVTYGDVLVDNGQGCTIWSTEEILAFLAAKFQKQHWPVKKIVHVTEVTGFLDEEKKLVSKITNKNWPQLKNALVKTKGFDVTGGMLHKIEQSLDLAQQGVGSVILSGLKKDNLYHALVGKSWIGTEIS